MTNPLTDIVMAAAALKAVAPDQYKQLLDALRSYEAQAVVDMVSADQPHEVFRSQGGLKIIQTLRRHLAEATEMRATYQRREPNARPNPGH